MTYKGIFASSQDPAQLSLTISSVSQALIGLVGFFAAAKGLDPSAATSQVQALVDVGTQVVVAGYTAYHSMQTAYGLVRKLYAYFFSDPSSLVTPPQAAIASGNLP